MSGALQWKKDGFANQVSDLMQACGSKKGFDPMPPDQHSWPMLQADVDPLFQLWSWMCANTIRRGHRWPYAVSTAGRPLYIEDAARDLRWAPENRVAEVHRRYAAHVELRDQIQADLIAASRIILDADEDIMWRNLWIKKIRETHRPKNGKGEKLAARRQRLQLILPGIQELVQTSRKSLQSEPSRLAQTAAGNGNCATSDQPAAKTAGAPESFPRVSFSVDNPHPSSSLHSEPPEATTTKEVFEALKPFNGDQHAAETLIARCRAHRPEVTAEEICRGIALKDSLARIARTNPIGLLLKAVPRLFEGGTVPTLATAAGAGGETEESPAAKAYRKSMERRQPKPCPTN